MPKGVTGLHRKGQNLAKTIPQKDRPKFNGEGLRSALRSYDRAPFIDLLVEWIGCGPKPEDIAEFAAKHPDKYLTAITSLARIAGFSEKTETRVDINVDIRKLSDSQLEDKLAQIALQMQLPSPIKDKTIDHEVGFEQQSDGIVQKLDTDQQDAPQQPDGEAVQ